MSDVPDKIVKCPRCYEQCGWCGDYRHMHGTIQMPNDTTRRYCTIGAFAPEGDNCPVCTGVMQVIESRSYRPMTPAPQGDL